MADKKKLRELLRTTDKDTVVHIGTRKGSGFFFIGLPSEFNVKAHDQATIHSLKAAIMTYKETLDNMDTYIVPKVALPFFMADDESVDSYCNACLRAHDRLNKIALDIVGQANTIKAIQRKLKKAATALSTFVSYGEREVADTYDRLQGDGIVVIIEGEEQGFYWFRDEYQHGKELGETP